MAFARFLVCEASNRWTVALRWARAGDADVPLVRTQFLDDCWRELRDSPASFLAIELIEANLEPVVERLQELSSRFPRARAAVMCDRSLASCQWIVREAGAVHVSVSIRDMANIVQLARRHFAQVERPQVGLRQQVLQRLAWQEP